MISGVVPTMIYYGLQILSPSYFLVASCIICAIVALATGVSSTVATVGVALLGIGSVMGISEGMIAGAIILELIWHKMSPLSTPQIHLLWQEQIYLPTQIHDVGYYSYPYNYSFDIYFYWIFIGNKIRCCRNRKYAFHY